ncbi:MAG: hypothetical protein MRY64_16210 [Hyphomonadaceae bacterium]|nr:hypothetical protein [Hyphomonadaceae bacterium]
MPTRQQLLEEVRRLESSVSVLSVAASHMPATAPESEFYQAEIPLAIEDAKLGLERLSELIGGLDVHP